MNEEAVQFLKKCIEYYSPSGEEEEYAKFLGNYLNDHKFNVRFDKVGNLIAKKGTGRPVLLLVSHLDTIPGELPIVLKDGKLYGRGAVDCKSSLAAIVYSICHFNFNQENVGKIIFAGIVQEESSLIGIEEFLKSDVKPDYAIFGEPTKINQICIGYKGRLCVGFKVITETGHVASSWQYINAVEISLEIWNTIKGVCWKLNKIYALKSEKMKYFNRIIPNISIISGGHLTNCVPSECTIHIDIRFPPNINSHIILTEIRNGILDFKHVYENQLKKEFQIQENISSLIEGFEIENDNLMIGALGWAIFNTIREKYTIIKKTGTTFINSIGIKYNVPSITYGPGDPRLEHTNNEFIDLKEFSECIEIYLKFFNKFYKMYSKKYAK